MFRNNFHGIFAKIESAQPLFSNVDTNIAKYIEENTHEIADLTISELAKRAYVSEASISRFCKKIGLRGFSELKYQIEKESQSDNIAKSLERDNLFSILYEDYDYLLKKHRELLNIDKVKRIVNDIVNANIVYIIGIMKSGMAAQHFSYRLRRYGINSFAIVDADEMLMLSGLAHANDFFIAFSDTGLTHAIVNSLNILKKHKIKSALITQYKSSPAVSKADYYLLYPTVSNFESPIDFPVMFLIDILIAFLVNTNPKKYIENYKTTLKYVNSLNKL